MTKLIEWLCGLSLSFGLWFLIVTKSINLNLSDKWDNSIIFFPIHCILLFGIYSLTIVLWRVYNFNDCPEAAEELQKQIKRAKEDLKSKGLNT